jgi:hypothetical protein
MQRDRDGNVIFLPTWWRSALAQAAKAISRYYKVVDKIHPALPVVGPVTRIKRRYGKGPDDVKLHEGFDVGAQVTVRFAIPGSMTVEQFAELLGAVGDYIGVSPYGWKSGRWGHFTVVEVTKSGSSGHPKGRKNRVATSDG